MIVYLYVAVCFLEDIMDAFTRYSRKIRMTLLKAVTVICFICLIYIPEGSSVTTKEQSGAGYYIVVVNGHTLGAMNSEDEIMEAMVIARGRISAQAGTIVYMDPQIDIKREETIFGQRLSVDEMADSMYDALEGSAISFEKQEAFTVRINDYTVTLGTKEEIVELIEGVKRNYDTNDEFQVRLAGNADASSTEFGLEIVKVDIGDSAAARVLKDVDGQTIVSPDEQTVFEDGVLAMRFSEPISITPTEVNAAQISSVEDALAEITKETEAKTIYTVKSGDTLSKIASMYNLTTTQLCDLNDGLTVDGIIGIGDEIIVTVPTPELSVRVYEEMTYEESYNADVQYIDDDTMYQGQYSVVQEGSEGYREVVAVVQYENGSEISRDIIKQTLLVESVPRILKRGTQTPPTFVKPIAGGRFTSGFGWRWGRMHNGVDWATPTGTSVKASSGGTIVRSGWYSTYGICIDIQHPNGTLTRYAHLSKTLVSVGQKVVQNQQIGLSGNTGNSTGPHLHFEIWVNGVARNPFSYLK